MRKDVARARWWEKRAFRKTVGGDLLDQEWGSVKEKEKRFVFNGGGGGVRVSRC